MIYGLIFLFVVWAYLHSLQKKRHAGRVKEQRRFLSDALFNAKKQN